MTDAVQFVGIEKSFVVHGVRGSRAVLKALRGVDLRASAGETVGIVGESGCGKSTLARIACGLGEPDAGAVHIGGKEITKLAGRRRRTALRDIQMIFQDPFGSLNPKHSVQRIISEPWLAYPDLVEPGGRDRRIAELMQMVGLSASFVTSRPADLSGGQRQRVGIARAIAANPKVLVADEAVSALDVSVQAQIVNLLSDLVAELGVCLLFIAHDLRVVKNIADRVAVMYLGRVVEVGSTDAVFSNPQHPYTRALLSSVPPTRPWRQQESGRVKLEGEVPSPVDIPAGCAFRSRCWRSLDTCRTVDPRLASAGAEDDPPGHLVACHNPLSATSPARAS